MRKIKSLLLEFKCEHVEDNLNFFLLSTLPDNKKIIDDIKQIAEWCKEDDGRLNVSKFEDNVNHDRYFNMYRVSNFTSCVYSYHNGNITSYHKSNSYPFDVDNFDELYHVDLDKSTEEDDIIDLHITGYFNLNYKLKGFYPFSDPLYSRFEGILSNLEILSLMVQLINNDTDYVSNPLVMGIFLNTYFEDYCKSVEFIPNNII